MNKYTIEFSEEAKDDLISIASYFKNTLHEPIISKKLIQKGIYNLSFFPQKFSIINDNYFKKFKIRKLIISHYIVFYIIAHKTNSIQIVRILYNKRDWKNFL